MAKLNATVAAMLVLLAFLTGQSAAGRYYYDKVQDKVRKEVENAMASNPSIGPALVRLLFHDCWVNGCDGSVLLDKTYTDVYGTKIEKKAANNIGLDGFLVIDNIKQKVGTNVSCADIVVFAARDAADILSGGKIFYTLTAGRMDGVVSSAEVADKNLPRPDFEVDQLKDNFNSRGFPVEQLVALSGAHSIGVAHLSSYKDRLATDSTATPIDSDFLAALNETTPLALLDKGQNPTVPNNVRDATDAFQKKAVYDPVAIGVNPKRGVLDNSYYHNNLVNKALFKSDWVLRTDDTAASKLDEYKDNPAKWNSDFALAMVKLSSLLPPQGRKLEIRKTNCRVPN